MSRPFCSSFGARNPVHGLRAATPVHGLRAATPVHGFRALAFAFVLTLLGWSGGTAPVPTLAVVHPQPLAAQAGLDEASLPEEASLLEEAPLVGRVLDRESGELLEGAAVYLPDRDVGYFTHSNGAFHFRSLPVGLHVVEVERIGYESVVTTVDITDPPSPVEFRLRPEPVILEGLEVVIDRFDRRRKATPTSIRVFREDQLRATGARDATDFVANRLGLPVVRCPDHMLDYWCVHRRGRSVSPSVYIDEMPAMTGLEHLSFYQPHELYMIEVYGRGQHIRAYTRHFMERAARIRLSPIPIVMF